MRGAGRPVSQLAPLYPVADAQSQPQEPVVPVAEPEFWQTFPSAPAVHASAAGACEGDQRRRTKLNTHAHKHKYAHTCCLVIQREE